MNTRAECIAAFSLIWAEGRAARDALSPRAAAEAAWYPEHPLGTVDDVEALIINQRRQVEAAEQPQHLPLAA